MTLSRLSADHLKMYCQCTFFVLFAKFYMYFIRSMKYKEQTYVIKTPVIIHMLSPEQATCKMMSWKCNKHCTYYACYTVHAQLNSIFSFSSSSNYGCGLALFLNPTKLVTFVTFHAWSQYICCSVEIYAWWHSILLLPHCCVVHFTNGRC